MKRNQVLNHFDLVLSHDKTQLHVFSGLRNAVGVFVALIVGIATGQVLLALGAAIGAQVAGFAGLNGTIHKRLQTMWLTAVYMAFTTFVGGEISGTWWAVVVITVLGFIAGFMSCVSTEAGLIGMWGTIVYILFSAFPHQSGTAALIRGLLVLAGVALQATLLIVAERLRPSRVEAKSVAKVYLALAQYAMKPSRQGDLQVATALHTAVSHLKTSALKVSYRNRLEALLDYAESIRIEVVALRGLLRSAKKEESNLDSDELAYVEEQAKGLVDGLQFIGGGLASGKTSANTDIRRRLQAVCERTTQHHISSDWNQLHECLKRGAGELLHAIDELESTPAAPHQPATDRWIRSPLFQLHTAWDSMRANFTFASATFRHAIRLAVALGIATLMHHFLPFSREYWLPLTTLIVLRPEFATTFSRGIARTIGTMLGAVVATLLLLIPDNTHILGALLVALLLWGMYAVLNYNLMLFTGVLTAEVVILLSFFQRAQPLVMLQDRVIYTLLGSGLAFLAYLAWPTWLRHSLPSSLAKLVSADGKYVQAVFHLLPTTAEQRQQYRKQARLARTNTVNLVNQAMKEPKMRPQRDRKMVRDRNPQPLEGLVTPLNRLADGLMTIESFVSNHNAASHSHSDVIRFGEYVYQCLVEIEARLGQYDEFAETKDWPRGMGSNSSRVGGALDEVSPYTKQEVSAMDIPESIQLIFIRMEDNLGTMFRILSDHPGLDYPSSHRPVT